MDAAVHEGKRADERIEEIAEAGDAQILPSKADQRSVAARIKTQHAVPGKSRYKEKQQRAEQVEHDLEAKTLFKGVPILCAEELRGVDVYAGVDAERNRAKQHVKLCGNGDRTHAAHMAYHDGVHKAGALVEDLLPGDGQSNAPDLSVKGGGREIGILPFFQQSSHCLLFYTSHF